MAEEEGFPLRATLIGLVAPLLGPQRCRVATSRFESPRGPLTKNAPVAGGVDYPMAEEEGFEPS